MTSCRIVVDAEHGGRGEPGTGIEDPSHETLGGRHHFEVTA